MQSIWKAVAVLCVAMLLLALPVFAGGDNANLPDNYDTPVVSHEEKETLLLVSEIHPCAPLCSSCDSPMVQTASTSTEWSTYDYEYCTCEGGGKPMDDALQEKYVTITYTCFSCNFSETAETRLTRRVHFG